MIKDVEVLVIHPLWLLVFVLGYGFGIYVFLKTDSIFAAGISVGVWLSATARLIYYYYLGV